ncbi:TadE/TadG family type IV pilus assembly protein [Isoptericola variabilis]|uniref:TadE family protein n=1 Tax=Isoptericola variabilis (strain 225) TaxID=743718 RepID=F6FQB2_ISOV2|nr:TadE/TadG family type IV pilus assembly protein [Isoptericola variabilis]AEG43787.1 TadE family protein [Isoptericola variabilis 225]TWH27469.1 TadE-like protein [Isoptericola variabilis J7]
MHDGERGSAVAEFVLVAALVLALFLGVVQVALALHVRALVVDAAAEGARIAARADRDASDGARRTRDLLTASLNASYARDVTVGSTTLAGLPVVEVTVRAPLPVVGILGPSGMLTARGHALEEG